MTASNDRITDAQVWDALDVLNRDYWQDVRDIRDNLREELKSGSLDLDADSINEWLEQSVDGHQRIIYTHQARVTLVCCDNPDAYEEEFGEKPATVEAQAMWAMLKDIRETMGDIDDLIAEFTPGEKEEAEG